MNLKAALSDTGRCAVSRSGAVAVGGFSPPFPPAAVHLASLQKPFLPGGSGCKRIGGRILLARKTRYLSGRNQANQGWLIVLAVTLGIGCRHPAGCRIQSGWFWGRGENGITVAHALAH